MNAIFPDVSRSETAPNLSALEWVGMQDIDMPVTIKEQDYKRDLHARVDLQVDLPLPHIKGIHMSRLYRLLNDGLGDGQALTPISIQQLLQKMINSHEDCGSNNARLKMKMDLIIKRPALITEDLYGWRSYPICVEAALVEAALIEGEFKLQVEVNIEYSSTCPMSAALTRQLVENGFREVFGGEAMVDVDSVTAWLNDHATLAKPHSQRSQAKVKVTAPDDEATELGLIALINCIEKAVSTPVQTAVKRADEQAFAALNGQNLMFVEDAARRIENALKDYEANEVYVRHIESLHPHDAVAWAVLSPGRG